MSSARQIKRRITSVKNIAKVTRALEAVSASRVRRAQEQVFNSRPYAQKAWEVLVNVAEATGANDHPLLDTRNRINGVAIILVTSDRSLCGSYNDNIIRVAEYCAKAQPTENVHWVTVGRKGRDALVRQGKNVIAEFSKLPTPLSISQVIPIGRIVLDEFLSGIVDRVVIAYTDFINTLTQKPTILNLLPLRQTEMETCPLAENIKQPPEVTTEGRDYIYEPNATSILDEIVPRFVTLQIYEAMLESLASEHSARMVAMRNASENAVALASDLTLIYNKARQAAITNEILDIVGGVNAMQQAKEADEPAILRQADAFIAGVGGALTE